VKGEITNKEYRNKLLLQKFSYLRFTRTCSKEYFSRIVRKRGWTLLYHCTTKPNFQ